MGQTKRIVVTAVVAALALVAGLAAGVAFASQPKATGTFSGKGVTAVNVVTSGSVAQTSDPTKWVEVPGAVTSITVPDTQQAFMLARFSAESACYGRVKGWCSVRILVGGAEANPITGTNFAFDSNDEATETASSWEAHSMDRSAGPLTSGNYTVSVQYRTVLTCNPCFEKPVFRLDDWTLTVERVKAG
jgi:hypothetical protein